MHRLATLRRRLDELSGMRILCQAGTELSIQAASGVVESLGKTREHKSLHHMYNINKDIQYIIISNSKRKINISCDCPK